MSETSTKCSKCAKETEDRATLCTDCAASMDAKEEKKQSEQEKEEKTKEDCVKMEIDTDLTTTETLDDLDELDKRTRQKEILRKNQQKQSESQAKEEQQEQEKQLQLESKVKEEKQQLPDESLSSLVASIKAERAAEGDAETKMAAGTSTSYTAQPTPPRGGGKITRSSLNGARSPNIIKRLRKSTRSTRFKAKLTGRGGTGGGGGAGGTGAAGATNGHNGATNCKAHGKLGAGSSAGGGGGATASTPKNRRTLFKRPAQKTPRVQATTRFVKSVFYKGSYMQIGDIVSIVDSEQNVYYAQIRGLLVDAYCEKSAFLTWLIPTQDSPDPKDGFDPATYLIGPDEELSRKLCYLEFIMHAPSNYYFDRTTPFPLPDVDEYTTQRTGGFIWTRLPIFKRDRERERERERERDRVGKAAA